MNSNYRFSGPQGPPSKSGTKNKGVMKSLRSRKRAEAETRSESTEHVNTRAHRLNCDNSCRFLLEIFETA